MRKSTLSAVTGVLLAAAIAGGVCACGYAARDDSGKWFKNSDFASWHWSDKADKGSDNIADDDIIRTSAIEENVFIEAEGRGLKLFSAAIPAADYANYGVTEASAENVFNLSVTYTPENATFQGTNYTMKFANANSAWASGKNLNDYAELQHTSGSKNATLVVKQAFGEPIIVTAMSQRDNTKTATFTVDYLKRIQSFKGTLRPNGDWDIATELEFSQNPVTFSDGTLTPDLDASGIRLVIDLGADFVSQLSSRGITAERYYYKAVGNGELVDREYFESLLGCFAQACNMSQSAFEPIFLDIYPWIVDESNDWKYGFLYNRVYDGVTYSGGVTDIANVTWFNLNVDGASLCVDASSINGNVDHIIAS